MSITLVTVKATCPDCGTVKSQIDTSREHAIEVVTTAMVRHQSEECPGEPETEATKET